MRTINQAVQHIDPEAMTRLSRQTGLALAECPSSPELKATCQSLVRPLEPLLGGPANPAAQALAMACLALGYAIARHEIGEELLGEGEREA